MDNRSRAIAVGLTKAAEPRAKQLLLSFSCSPESGVEITRAPMAFGSSSADNGGKMVIVRPVDAGSLSDSS